MLNLTGLENDLKTAFEESLPGAFEVAFQSTFPVKSNAGNDMAKNLEK